MPLLPLLAVLVTGALAGETQEASIPAGQARKCLIRARGRVSVTGAAGDQVTYRLTPRRGPASVRVYRLPGGVLRLAVVDGPETEADLEVALPRAMDQLILESRTGPIELTSLEAEVMARSAAGSISADRISRGADLRTGGGEIRAGILGGALKAFSAAGSIFVREAGEVRAITDGGEIQVRESHGAVTARTAGGNIRVDRARGLVDARTRSGVVVIGAAGSVAAVTGSGSIEVSRAGAVEVTSARGSLRLKEISGPISARTGGGVILAELAANRNGPATFQSLDGDIVLVLPSNQAMTVEAFSWNSGNAAEIRSDFAGLQLRPEARGEQRGVAAQLILQGGGPVVRLEAAGRIDLRRRDSGSGPEHLRHPDQRKKIQEKYR